MEIALIILLFVLVIGSVVWKDSVTFKRIGRLVLIGLVAFVLLIITLLK